MISRICTLLVLIHIVLCEKQCYFNAQCPFLLHSTKTPYVTVRGDIRDYHAPAGCETLSIWSLNRHGNRNPGTSTLEDMKHVSTLRDEIVRSFDEGRGELCAQDIDEFRQFVWNATVEVSVSYLTGEGYEELYDIATRIRQRFPQLLTGEDSQYYFRPTNEQRTVTSAMAFVHGLSEGTNLNLTLDGPYARDDVIRPYENCQRYQDDVKSGPEVTEQLEAYDTSPDYLAIRDAVQQRLGITTQLEPKDVYAFYELCRFYRSWNPLHQSPWCSVFTNDDLVVLEYRDDVRHYHRNGYGSWVNVNLGGPAVKNMFDSLQAVVSGQQDARKVTGYFSHDTMLEMFFCALGLFKDEVPLSGSSLDPLRVWRTSQIAPFSNNFMAILNRCNENGNQIYRVQFMHNEKETSMCTSPGCTWQEFESRFQHFTNTSLDFCDPSYVTTTTTTTTTTMRPEVSLPEGSLPDSAVINSSFAALLVFFQAILLLR